MRRVKTFKEFGNKRPTFWNKEGYMDCYYGRVFPEEYGKSHISNSNKWTFQSSDFIEMTGFSEKPKNVKEGDKFMVVRYKKMSGIYSETYVCGTCELSIGSIVTLSNDDGTSCPYFTLPKGNIEPMDWGYLSPYYGHVDDLSKEKEKTPTHPIGAKFKVIHKNSHGFQIGEIVTLYEHRKGEDDIAWFDNGSFKQLVNFTDLELLLNTVIQHEHNQQKPEGNSTSSDDCSIFLRGVSLCYSTGQAPVGVVVSGTREKISLGD